MVIFEFNEQNTHMFDEIMGIIKNYSDAEYLRIKDELILSLPGLDIYPDRRKVYRNSNEINLTTKEFEIFYLLVVKWGRVLTYDHIYHKVWNEYTIGNEKNAVKCHIRNIREKLDMSVSKAPFEIRCIREVGYCFEVDSK